MIINHNLLQLTMDISNTDEPTDRQARIKLLHTFYNNNPIAFQKIVEPISYDIIYHASDEQLLKWQINLASSSVRKLNKNSLRPSKNPEAKEPQEMFIAKNIQIPPKELCRLSRTHRPVLSIDNEVKQASNVPQESVKGTVRNTTKLPRKEPSKDVLLGKRKVAATNSKTTRKKPSTISNKHFPFALRRVVY